MKILNQLQNSDIGSYEHFETDLNSIAILPLEVYLELEKGKIKEIEEPKSESSEDNAISDTKSKEQKDKKEKEKNLLKE